MMTITEARKRCAELEEQTKAVEEEYFLCDGLAKYERDLKMKPITDEWSKLMSLITKAENRTNI